MNDNLNNDEDFYVQLASSLRSQHNKYDMCRNEVSTLKKCLLCKAYLSSNQWSVMLEEHIRYRFNIAKKKDNVSGDGNTSNNFNVEIKVSLGTDNGQVHFVQIRPDHNVDYYILLVYNVHEGTIGRLHWLLCNAKELYSLLPEYGGYAHGTVERLGKISFDNIQGRNCEYALRPNLLAKSHTKQRRLWDKMIEMFEVSEEELMNRL